MDDDASMDELAAGLLSGNSSLPEPPPDASSAASPPGGASRETEAPKEPEPEPQPSSDAKQVEAEPEPPSETEAPEPPEPPKSDPAAEQQRLAAAQHQQRLVAEQQQLLAAVQAMEAQREHYARMLDEVQRKLGSADGEPTAEQWNALRQAEIDGKVPPGSYGREWADQQRREYERSRTFAQQQAIARQQQQEAAYARQQALEIERVKLHAAIPELADPAKGDQELAALQAYARKLGFSQAEIDQAADHRTIVALDKARRWDEARAAGEAKVASAPALAPPAGRTGFKSPRSSARDAAQKRFEQTGRPDDGAELLIQ